MENIGIFKISSHLPLRFQLLWDNYTWWNHEWAHSGKQNDNPRLFHQNFLHIGPWLVPRPLRSLTFNQKSVKFMQKLTFKGVWTRGPHRCEKIFDWDVWTDHSSFQNGVIHDFIMCSYLKMVENVKVGGLKFRKFLYFPYNTSFWKNCNCNSSRRFQEPIFGTPILN